MLEQAGIDAGRVDGFDPVHDDQAGAAIAGARIAVYALGGGQGQVFGRGVQCDGMLDAGQRRHDVALEDFGVDIGRGQDDFGQAPRQRRLLRQHGRDGPRQAAVTHAVRDQVNVLGVGGAEEIDQEAGQVGGRPFDIGFIDHIAGHRALRRPAVEQRGAVETEVVGHLAGAARGVFEADVITVHEQEGAFFGRALDLRRQRREKDILVLHLGVEQDHMAFGILAKLEAPQRRRLQRAHAVVARNADVAIAVADLGTLDAEFARRFALAGQVAVGGEKHLHHRVVERPGGGGRGRRRGTGRLRLRHRRHRRRWRRIRRLARHGCRRRLRGGRLRSMHRHRRRRFNLVEQGLRRHQHVDVGVGVGAGQAVAHGQQARHRAGFEFERGYRAQDLVGVRDFLRDDGFQVFVAERNDFAREHAAALFDGGEYGGSDQVHRLRFQGGSSTETLSKHGAWGKSSVTCARFVQDQSAAKACH